MVSILVGIFSKALTNKFFWTEFSKQQARRNIQIEKAKKNMTEDVYFK